MKHFLSFVFYLIEFLKYQTTFQNYEWSCVSQASQNEKFIHTFFRMPWFSQIAFPGFGYWPRWYADTFRNLSLKAALPNYLNDTELRNRNLCDIVTFMYKEGVVPNRNLALDRVEDGVSGIMCPPLWDRASCFPATHAGQMSVIPCMAEFNEVYYDTTGRRTLSLQN